MAPAPPMIQFSMYSSCKIIEAGYAAPLEPCTLVVIFCAIERGSEIALSLRARGRLLRDVRQRRKRGPRRER